MHGQGFDLILCRHYTPLVGLVIQARKQNDALTFFLPRKANHRYIQAKGYSSMKDLCVPLTLRFLYKILNTRLADQNKNYQTFNWQKVVP